MRRSPPPWSSETGDPLTILVVVGDDDVRGLIRRMLEGSGYRVLEAVDADQALDLASSAEIEGLVTEVAPFADGWSVAERLRLLAPALPVLYVTGWFDHPDFTGLLGEPVLKTPFSRDELTHAIGAVLRGDPDL